MPGDARFYIDEAGRGRRDPAERARAPVTNEHAHIMAFADWMRDHRPLLPGTRIERDRFATSEIVEFYRWFCWEAGCEQLFEARFLALFSAVPGIERRRPRVTGSKDPQIRYVAELFGTSRIRIYRVTSHEEMEWARARAATPATRRDFPNRQRADAGAKRRASEQVRGHGASEARHDEARGRLPARSAGGQTKPASKQRLALAA